MADVMVWMPGLVWAEVGFGMVSLVVFCAFYVVVCDAMHSALGFEHGCLMSWGAYPSSFVGMPVKLGW